MSGYLIREIGSTPSVEVCYRVQIADSAGTGHLESLVLAQSGWCAYHVPDWLASTVTGLALSEGEISSRAPTSCG